MKYFILNSLCILFISCSLDRSKESNKQNVYLKSDSAIFNTIDTFSCKSVRFNLSNDKVSNTLNGIGFASNDLDCIYPKSLFVGKTYVYLLDSYLSGYKKISIENLTIENSIESIKSGYYNDIVSRGDMVFCVDIYGDVNLYHKDRLVKSRDIDGILERGFFIEKNTDNVCVYYPGLQKKYVLNDSLDIVSTQSIGYVNVYKTDINVLNTNRLEFNDMEVYLKNGVYNEPFSNERNIELSSCNEILAFTYIDTLNMILTLTIAQK